MGRADDLYHMKEVLDGCSRLDPLRLAVSRPYDDATLVSMDRAVRKGIVHPLLIGRRSVLNEHLSRLQISPDGFEIVDTEEEDILEATASLFHDREADFIMKGLVGTGAFIQVLLDPKWRIRTEDILSHVGMFEIPHSGRIFLMSDAALNILPNFSRKMEIVKNAVHAARSLGIRKVRVAMLAAVEKVRLPAMPATRDAFLMKKFAATGYFGRCNVDGPFAFDNALDEEKADTKGIGGKVAGRANVLIVPNIETGNVIWKSITVLNKQQAAGVVIGGSCPIVLPSRSDDWETKFRSVQFARLLQKKG
jgi:phosphate butyryltransferase